MSSRKMSVPDERKNSHGAGCGSVGWLKPRCNIREYLERPSAAAASPASNGVSQSCKAACFFGSCFHGRYGQPVGYFC